MGTQATPALADRSALGQNRAATAERVRELAAKSRLSARQDLLALAEAVELGGDREAPWRDIALIPLFPARSILLPRGSELWGRFLTVVAAVIVFLPIMWTWFGLRAAVSQYRVALADGTADGQSLLQLWTAGFDGHLSDHLALPSVAFGSAVLIGLSMVLVLLERLVEANSDWRSQQAEQEFEAQLSSALLTAELTLRLNSVETPDRGMDLLRDSVDALVAANDKMSETIVALTDAGSQLASGATAASQEFENSAKSFNSTLLDAARNAGNGLQTSLNSAADSFRTATLSAVGDLTSSVAQLSAAAVEQSNVVSQTAAMTQTLTQAAGEISSNTRQFSNSLTATANDLRTSLAQPLTTIGDKVAELQASTQGLGDVLTHHTSAAQSQITELTQIRAGIAQLVSGTQPAAIPKLNTVARN